MNLLENHSIFLAIGLLCSFSSVYLFITSTFILTCSLISSMIS